jgi:hypothetical protein
MRCLLLFKSGYRVTLTYNLYFPTPGNPHPPPPLHDNVEDHIKPALQALLNDPKFLADRGMLGFGLSNKYSFENSTKLSALETTLTGTDALVKQIWEEVFSGCRPQPASDNALHGGPTTFPRLRTRERGFTPLERRRIRI